MPPLHSFKMILYRLTDIAYQLNFGTQSSFTRAFKRQYGVTPSSLREKDNNLLQCPYLQSLKDR